MADFVKIYNTNGVPLYINLDHIICVEFQKNNKKILFNCLNGNISFDSIEDDSFEKSMKYIETELEKRLSKENNIY